MNHIETLIDSIIGNKGLESDIAELAYELLHPYVRYYSVLRRWEIKNVDVWKPDTKGEKVWEMMRTIVGVEMVKRALYWEKMASSCNHKDDSELLLANEYSHKSLILMEINKRFYNRSNKKPLLEEMKAYFESSK